MSCQRPSSEKSVGMWTRLGVQRRGVFSSPERSEESVRFVTGLRVPIGPLASLLIWPHAGSHLPLPRSSHPDQTPAWLSGLSLGSARQWKQTGISQEMIGQQERENQLQPLSLHPLWVFTPHREGDDELRGVGVSVRTWESCVLIVLLETRKKTNNDKSQLMNKAGSSVPLSVSCRNLFFGFYCKTSSSKKPPLYFATLKWVGLMRVACASTHTPNMYHSN